MMLFIVALGVLVLVALILFNHAKKIITTPKNLPFDRLQQNYLNIYFLATFADWLQGPYVYRLYSYYGFEEEDIAVLYIVGFASSSVFGGLLGYFADKYGRKVLCFMFGFLYSVCCFTKLSSEFYMLFLGRIFGGISTSILFSTFEAWYINEHVNHLKLPPAWVNVTLSKASFYTGLLAILAGVLAQICAENLSLGPVSPFILAIPFLLMSSYLICRTWEEHPFDQNSSNQSFIAPLQLILVKDPLLLLLGLIQSLFEAVLYTFIFSWTPILSDLNPPLGIVFACFMVAFMIGSKLYTVLLSDRLPPQTILVLTSLVALISFTTITLVITCILHGSLNIDHRAVLIQLCFWCFILYEICVGMYIPVIGYLKCRVVPEEYRASISNWFRVPMNIFTCISLTLNQISKAGTVPLSHSLTIFKKFYLIYLLCSLFLIVTALLSFIFKRKYSRKFSREESSFCLQTDLVEDKSVSVQ